MNLEHPLFVNLPRAMEAFSSYPGNSLDRQVFADIAQFANRYGVSFTTEKAIAKRLGRRREEISKSVNRLKEKGFLAITMAKKGLDRHPRNVYRIAPQFLRRHPDKRSPHYNEAAWRRWCEIGRKRAATIALRKKQAAQAAARTVRDTAARLAGAKHPASAKTSQPVPLTPSQASAARQQRGGGFAAFGSALAGLFGATPAAAATVTDTYTTELQRRGDIAQMLRQHEAAQQAATVMAIQLPQQAAAPMVATLAVPPTTQDRAAARASQPTPKTTAPAETVAASHSWRDNVPAAYRKTAATGEATARTEKPAQANAKARGDTVPAHATWRARCRFYAAQGHIKLKPGSPATVEA